MGANSKIEWCHHTFNLAWGCTKVSEACRDCYAEAIAKHWGFDVWGKDKPRRTFGEKHWNEPLKWNAIAKELGERHRVFCSSMADVFEDHPTIAEERLKLWPLIERTPWLDWLLLTKRPENAIQFAPRAWNGGWPDNAWVGTTVEGQERASRISFLVNVPARIRFLSCEPLLSPLNVAPFLGGWTGRSSGLPSPLSTALESLPDIHGIDWVIAGGESGSHARPAHPDWFRSLRDQCVNKQIPFFFKQHGEWISEEDLEYLPIPAAQIADAEDFFGIHTMYSGDHCKGLHCGATNVYRVGKKKAGRLLDGREWSEFPEVK